MKIIHFFANKYIVCIIVFLLVLFGNNRIGTNRDLKQQIKDKERTIKEERERINAVEQYILSLQNDPVMQEEYVRNHYYMKKPNEEIFRMVGSDNLDKKKHSHEASNH